MATAMIGNVTQPKRHLAHEIVNARLKTQQKGKCGCTSRPRSPRAAVPVQATTRGGGHSVRAYELDGRWRPGSQGGIHIRER